MDGIANRLVTQGSFHNTTACGLLSLSSCSSGVELQYIGPGHEGDDTSWLVDAFMMHTTGTGLDQSKVKLAKPQFTGDTEAGEEYSFKVTFTYKVKTTEMKAVPVEKTKQVRDYGETE